MYYSQGPVQPDHVFSCSNHSSTHGNRNNRSHSSNSEHGNNVGGLSFRPAGFRASMFQELEAACYLELHTLYKS